MHYVNDLGIDREKMARRPLRSSCEVIEDVQSDQSGLDIILGKRMDAATGSIGFGSVALFWKYAVERLCSYFTKNEAGVPPTEWYK